MGSGESAVGSGDCIFSSLPIPHSPFFCPLFSVSFSFLNLRTAQPFNSASGKSESHKRTSLQQTLRLRERSEQENKALSEATGVARILFI